MTPVPAPAPDTVSNGGAAEEGGRVTDDADRSKLLEWIEKQGQDSLKARFATAELLAKEAQTTLTVLLAGAGGTAAYAAKIFEPGPAGPVVFGSVAACVYLVFLCITLVMFCMMFQSYPALYQDPLNLKLEAPLDDIREAEIDNIDARIKEAAQLNAARGRRLNTIRLLAAMSPFIFAAAAALTPPASEKPLEKGLVHCTSQPASAAGTTTLRCEFSR